MAENPDDHQNGDHPDPPLDRTLLDHRGTPPPQVRHDRRREDRRQPDGHRHLAPHLVDGRGCGVVLRQALRQHMAQALDDRQIYHHEDDPRDEAEPAATCGEDC